MDQQPASQSTVTIAKPDASVIAGWVLAALIIIGSFGPWASLGFIKASGIDGGDGWISLVLGGLIAGSVYTYYRDPKSRRLAPFVTFLLAGVTAGLATYEIDNVSSAGSGAFAPDIGWGLLMIAGSSGLLMLLAIALFLDRNK